MAGPEDEIDGKPETMLHWKTNSCPLINPAADLVPGMDEGKTYQAKDAPATRTLVEFVQAAALGANAYNTKAKAAGHDYLDSDEAAEQGIKGISRLHEPISNVTSRVGVVSEWPPTMR
ncbi:hypothetical protein [Actinophytocola sediminis]